MHSVWVELLDFGESFVFGDWPGFDKLNERDFEIGAEGAKQEPQGGFGFALPCPGEDNYA